MGSKPLSVIVCYEACGLVKGAAVQAQSLTRHADYIYQGALGGPVAERGFKRSLFVVSSLKTRTLSVVSVRLVFISPFDAANDAARYVA